MGAALEVPLHAAPSAAQVSHADLQALADQRAAAREAELHAAGEQAGRAAPLEAGAAALQELLAELEQRALSAEEQLSHQAVELAVEIARAVLQTRIEAGDHDLERVVRAALTDAEVGRGHIVVHVNPQDHEQLQGVALRSGTSLEVDPALSRGDVHLSTPRGLLVRNVDAALDSIREQLLEDLVQ